MTSILHPSTQYSDNIEYCASITELVSKLRNSTSDRHLHPADSLRGPRPGLLRPHRGDLHRDPGRGPAAAHPGHPRHHRHRSLQRRLLHLPRLSTHGVQRLLRVPHIFQGATIYIEKSDGVISMAMFRCLPVWWCSDCSMACLCCQRCSP